MSHLYRLVAVLGWFARAACAVMDDESNYLPAPANPMVPSDPASEYVLTLSCPSAAGQVAAIAGFLEARGCYIDEVAVFNDKLNQSFSTTASMT